MKTRRFERRWNDCLRTVMSLDTSSVPRFEPIPNYRPQDFFFFNVEVELLLFTRLVDFHGLSSSIFVGFFCLCSSAQKLARNFLNVAGKMDYERPIEIEILRFIEDPQ
jgi:hypothetical protein